MPSSISDARPREAIRARAFEHGFEAVGFARAQAPPGAAEGLQRFLDEGHHGSMGWMARTRDRRADPRALWPEAKSVVVLGANYGPAGEPLEILQQKTRGGISVYARGDDYHEVMKAKLRRLAEWIAREYASEVKIFVDTAPVMEKPLAEAAGLGWQGKHTNLVSREFGSWLFLGSVFTTLDLAPDAPESDHCGACRRCLDICPTDAFPAPYEIDARRCISYLTIEHDGHIAEEFRAAIGNRIYGCDDCLAVCPWNKFARTASETRFHHRMELTAPRLADLAELDDAAFRKVFAKSPVKRTGRDRFVRNVMIAIGNSGERALAPSALGRLADASPLVRAMAVWALARLLPHEEFTALAAEHLESETDGDVRREWTAASARVG